MRAHNILVTGGGGGGYIGSHTCKALAAAGHHPGVLDNLVSGHRWAAKWGTFLKGDPSMLVSEPRAAGEILGRKPRYCDSETIVDSALVWHAKHIQPLKMGVSKRGTGCLKQVLN